MVTVSMTVLREDNSKNIHTTHEYMVQHYNYVQECTQVKHCVSKQHFKCIFYKRLCVHSTL